MKDLAASACTNWSPGAFGPTKYKNENPEVALLCFNTEKLKHCWIYDDSKKKFRRFRPQTKFNHLDARVGHFQGHGFR